MVAWPSMKRLPAAVFLAWATSAAHAADSWKPFSAALPARSSHEECLHLEKDDARRYHWKGDAAVDFNIHYHEGNEAIYPVKRDGMRADGGSFKPRLAQEYCWMWTARDKPVKLEGRIETREPAEPGSDPVSPKK